MKKMKYIDSLSLGSTLPTTISNLWSDLYDETFAATNYAMREDVGNDVREQVGIFEDGIRQKNLTNYNIIYAYGT